MKATKLILAIAFIAFTTLAYAQTDRPDHETPPPSLTIKMSLKVALQNPELVKSMQEQLEPNFFKSILRPEYYTAKVLHRRIVFVIYGTLGEWKKFFSIRPDDPSGIAD